MARHIVWNAQPTKVEWPSIVQTLLGPWFILSLTISHTVSQNVKDSHQKSWRRTEEGKEEISRFQFCLVVHVSLVAVLKVPVIACESHVVPQAHDQRFSRDLMASRIESVPFPPPRVSLGKDPSKMAYGVSRLGSRRHVTRDSGSLFIVHLPRSVM